MLIKIITGGLKRVPAQRRIVASKAFVFESSEKKFLSVKLEVLSEVLFVRFCKQRVHGCKISVHCLVGITRAVCVFKTYLIAHYFNALRKKLLLLVLKAWGSQNSALSPEHVLYRQFWIGPLLNTWCVFPLPSKLGFAR